MKRLKILAAVLWTAVALAPASAQNDRKDYKPYPYTFVGLQGGGQVTFTNNSFKNLVTPVGAVSVGHFFSPVVGARVNVSGWKNKAGYKVAGTDRTYDFKYVTSDLDMMINLTQAFAPKKNHVLNVFLIGGVGLTYAWDKEGQQPILSGAGISEPLAWKDDRMVHNWRVGMQLEANVAKHWGVNLEVTANHLDDRFNGKLNGNPDWQVVGLIGVTYKFGFKKREMPKPVVVPPTPKPQPQPRPQPRPEPKPQPRPQPQPKPQPKAPEKIRVDVFFDVSSSAVRTSEEVNVAHLAKWLKDHPGTTVYVTGYADKGTGNAEGNRRFAQKRAQKVADRLTDKYGIEASRIVVDSKGDTVQPFPENDRNRVVIATAEEKK